MTETTKTDPIEKAKAHITGLPGFSEYCDYLYSRQGHGLPPAGDFLCAISKLVSSLTKERDKALVQQKSLEEEVDAISRQLDYEKAAGLAYRKVDVLKNDHAINLKQRYYKDIQELNSLLSKAEEENKELKGNSEIFYTDPDDPYLEERSSLELAASMVSFNGGPVAELQVYAKKRLPNVFIIKRGCEHKAFTTKEEALASLNKEGEEK